MSTESREFVRWRSDLYAAEASKCVPDVGVDPDVDEELNGVCVICGNWRFIPPMMHVCVPCFREE